jgi:hypothetical protein
MNGAGSSNGAGDGNNVGVALGGAGGFKTHIVKPFYRDLEILLKVGPEEDVLCQPSL